MSGLKILGLTLLISTLLFSTNVLAIGISPVYRELYFEPGMSKSFYFIMIGQKEGDLMVRPYVDGYLSNYTTVPDQAYLIPEGKGVTIHAQMDLPESLPPGRHMLHVGIMEELPSGSGGRQGISARLGVESLVAVRVPYPSKYLETEIDCGDVAVGDTVNFNIDVFNRGIKDLQDVSGHVEIFSPDHSKKGRVNMNEGSLFLPSMKNAKFSADWDTTGVIPGMYEAVATINYDGNETSAVCHFRVGELNIEIVSFGANDTLKDGIAKFYALLKSTWNSGIPQVFNTITIRSDNGEIVGTSSGETIRVGGWSKRELTVYWDTEGNDIGEYEAELLLEYEGKNSTKKTKFRVVSGFEGISGSFQKYWYVIVILLLVVLLAYQAIKNKHPRGKKKKG